MTTYENIIKLLADKSVYYSEIDHPEVITAVEASKVREGISLNEGAKSLILKIKRDNKKEYVNVVICGNEKFNSKLLKSVLDTNEISFASPEEVMNVTNGVQPGGVPPFGNLFGIKVYADENLLKNEKIAFSAGSRTKTIVMNVVDWQTIVNPIIIKLY